MVKLQGLGGALPRVLRYAFFSNAWVTVRIASGDSLVVYKGPNCIDDISGQW